MMRIHCPWCGDRPESEFHCGGTSHIQRPGADCSEQVWADYMFTRENPLGLHAERWRHTFGCSQWFNVLRDTATHEIKAVYHMTDPKPEVSP